MPSRWLERAMLADIGVLAAVVGWRLGGPILEGLRDLWLHTVPSASLSLHLGGLALCH